MHSILRRISLITTVIPLLFASSCKECDKVEAHVLRPTGTINVFLETRPSGQEIATLCPEILRQIKDMPEGTEAMRTLIREKYLNVENKCLRWQEAKHYRCQPTIPYGTCQPDLYLYCAQWEHIETPLPGYDEAIALSQNIDEFYQMTQSMCIDALAGKFDDAYGKSIAVQDIYLGKIKGRQLEFYQAACPSRQTSNMSNR